MSRSITSVYVNNIAHRLEGVERNTDRKYYLRYLHILHKRENAL